MGSAAGDRASRLSPNGRISPLDRGFSKYAGLARPGAIRPGSWRRRGLHVPAARPRRADLSPSGPGDAWGVTRDTACSAAVDWHRTPGSAATAATPPPTRRRTYRASTPWLPASSTGPGRWPRRDPVACPRCRRCRRSPPPLPRLPRSRGPRRRAPRPAGRNRITCRRGRRASPPRPVLPPRLVLRRRPPGRLIRRPRCRPPLSRPRQPSCRRSQPRRRAGPRTRRRPRRSLQRIGRVRLRRTVRGHILLIVPGRPRPIARGRCRRTGRPGRPIRRSRPSTRCRPGHRRRHHHPRHPGRRRT
jgi:hypothetical protein